MLPIILRLRAGESFERGAWHLGRHYKWIDVLAILWIIFICIIFMLPAFKAGVPGIPRSTGTSSTTRESWSAPHSSSSAAGTCCPPGSGSRDRSGRATKPSWERIEREFESPGTTPAPGTIS